MPRPNDGSSTYPCAVRSWNVTRETGSSQRSSADLLILARTIEPSRCANSTISPAWARMTETASASSTGRVRKICWNFSDNRAAGVWPSIAANAPLANNMAESCPTTSMGTGIRLSTTSAGSLARGGRR